MLPRSSPVVRFGQTIGWEVSWIYSFAGDCSCTLPKVQGRDVLSVFRSRVKGCYKTIFSYILSPTLQPLCCPLFIYAITNWDVVIRRTSPKSHWRSFPCGSWLLSNWSFSQPIGISFDPYRSLPSEFISIVTFRFTNLRSLSGGSFPYSTACLMGSDNCLVDSEFRFYSSIHGFRIHSDTGGVGVRIRHNASRLAHLGSVPSRSRLTTHP